MNSRLANILLAGSLAALAMTANAQYGTPGAPADKSTAAGATTGEKRMSENDIRAFREGRRVCNKMTGAAQEDCRKQLSAKYVDKQCRNLTGMKLDECLKAEYPGE